MYVSVAKAERDAMPGGIIGHVADVLTQGLAESTHCRAGAVTHI